MKRKVKQGQTYYLVYRVGYYEFEVYQIFIQNVIYGHVYFTIIYPGVKIKQVCPNSIELKDFNELLKPMTSFKKALSKAKYLVKLNSTFELK